MIVGHFVSPGQRVGPAEVILRTSSPTSDSRRRRSSRHGQEKGQRKKSKACSSTLQDKCLHCCLAGAICMLCVDVLLSGR
eukprot:jgi/Botrbrau1/19419/Bobra.0338s0046.1